MIAWAAHAFKLARRRPDGSSLGEHLRAVERQTRRTPPELIGPDFPREFATVWAWFAELNETRGANGFGPSPLAYAEIDAWRRLTGRRPSPADIAILRALDRAWLDAQHAKSDPPTGES